MLGKDLFFNVSVFRNKFEDGIFLVLIGLRDFEFLNYFFLLVECNVILVSLERFIFLEFGM